MKIGINALFLVPGDVGGTEIYFRQNLRRMVASNSSIQFVLFVTSDSINVLKEDLALCDNVEMVSLPVPRSIRPVRIVVEQLLLPLVILRHKIDVLWSPGYTAPLLCHCPQAVTIHDLQYKTHPEDLSWLERWTLDFLVKNGCKKCDAVISVSEFSKQEILRFNFAGSHKVVAVPEGVDPEFGQRVQPDDDGQLARVPKEPYILCVAHTYPHKRVDLLIRAFSLLEKEIDLQLVLVGKARRGEERVQQSITTLSDKKRLTRLQSLTTIELRALYQNAALFVLPSEYEGFGLPILEAMLAGTPVISVEKASIPEVGGEYVTYVDDSTHETFSKGILSVLNRDVQETNELIIKGQDWAEGFTWDKSAEKTMQVLTNLKKSQDLPEC